MLQQKKNFPFGKSSWKIWRQVTPLQHAKEITGTVQSYYYSSRTTFRGSTLRDHDLPVNRFKTESEWKNDKKNNPMGMEELTRGSFRLFFLNL